MLALSGYRRDRYVSQHPSGVIMNILEDGPLDGPLFDPAEEAGELDSITTVESRSVPGSPVGTPRHVEEMGGSRQVTPQAPTPGVGPSAGSAEPWVLVPKALASGAASGTTCT